jgi:hypothetical protein
VEHGVAALDMSQSTDVMAQWRTTIPVRRLDKLVQSYGWTIVSGQGLGKIRRHDEVLCCWWELIFLYYYSATTEQVDCDMPLCYACSSSTSK